MGLVAQHAVLKAPQHHFSDVEVPSQGVIPLLPPVPSGC
jgi:hypothetical protein